MRVSEDITFPGRPRSRKRCEQAEPDAIDHQILLTDGLGADSDRIITDIGEIETAEAGETVERITAAEMKLLRYPAHREVEDVSRPAGVVQDDHLHSVRALSKVVEVAGHGGPAPASQCCAAAGEAPLAIRCPSPGGGDTIVHV